MKQMVMIMMKEQETEVKEKGTCKDKDTGKIKFNN